MSQTVDTGYKASAAAGAIGLYLRVKTWGALALAGIADQDAGTAMNQAFASGDMVNVSLANKMGTTKMVAAAAIAANALVYTAASGKVSVSASTAFPIGTAVEAAGADGDIIEVQRTGFGTVVV